MVIKEISKIRHVNNNGQIYFGARRLSVKQSRVDFFKAMDIFQKEISQAIEDNSNNPESLLAKLASSIGKIFPNIKGDGIQHIMENVLDNLAQKRLLDREKRINSPEFRQETKEWMENFLKKDDEAIERMLRERRRES